MKKFRFALLALGVAVISFAFSPSTKVSSFATVYAFDSDGNFMGSAISESALKNQLCPGADQILCAEVWTSKAANGEPAGTRLEDIQKPNTP